jgi:DNA end-binding protein Ku
MPAYWTGYLKVALVTCPVSLTPATTETEKIKFRTLNRATGNPVKSRYVDAVTGAPVDEQDLAKGYQVEEGEVVVFEQDELDAVKLESVHTIDVELFAPAGSVGTVYLDKPYYLQPSDPVGEEAFAVIREGMRSTKTIGISRLVLGTREHAVMIEPRDRGVVLWTLRFGNEVRDEAPYFADIGEGETGVEEAELLGQLIELKTTPWDPDLIQDPIQDRLAELIAAKRKHKPPPKPAAATTPAPRVTNIMDALRRSIAAEQAAKAAPAPRRARGRANQPATETPAPERRERGRRRS